MNKEIITIKGTKQGLVFYCNTDKHDFEEIKNALVEKFQDSGGFFTSASFFFDHDHTFDCEELKILEEICINNGMIKVSDENFVSSSSQPKSLSSSHEGFEFFNAQSNAVLISRSLRSGQKIYVIGNAIILGDVNPGAEVVATGNIIVMGVFRGLAHAGSHGEKDAFIMAYRLQPNQLRIADKVSRSPETASTVTYSEIAKIIDNNIIIEPYMTPRQKVVNS